MTRAAFRCPDCGLPVPDAGCGHYEVDGDVVDFLPKIAPPKGGLGILYLRDPLHVPRYESQTRPEFLKLMGSNWTGAVAVEDEHAFLREQVRPGRGPVLDVACGAGTWTRTLVELTEPDRVVGVDISRAMIALFTANLPGVRIGRADAARLPFGTGTIGAVNCWNSFQLLPEPWAALAEMARVLEPGGSLTLFTYRTATRPLQRYFQLRHEAAFGVCAFDEEVLRGKLIEAGFEITRWQAPGTFLLISARRCGPGQPATR